MYLYVYILLTSYHISCFSKIQTKTLKSDTWIKKSTLHLLSTTRKTDIPVERVFLRPFFSDGKLFFLARERQRGKEIFIKKPSGRVQRSRGVDSRPSAGEISRTTNVSSFSFFPDIQEFYELTLLDDTKSIQQKTAETIRIANKWEANDGPITPGYKNDVSWFFFLSLSGTGTSVEKKIMKPAKRIKRFGRQEAERSVSINNANVELVRKKNRNRD